MQERMVTGLVGALFVGVAIVIMFTAGNDVYSGLAALVIGALGVEAIVSAVRGRRALLSRIGPLP